MPVGALRGCSLQAESSSNLLVAPVFRLGSLVYESSTSTAKWVSLGVPRQGVAVLILHPQESPPLWLSGCSELLLPPAPRLGCPFSFLYFCSVRTRCEDDDTGPPRPPGSSLGPRSLRPGQVGGRFNVSSVDPGLLVDASGR